VTNIQKPDDLLARTFARLDAIALGASCGVVCGLGVFAATAILLIKGGEQIGPNLGLLSQYFIGYSVSWTGSIIGAVYGFVTGFITGWTIAFVRNVSIATYMHAVRLRAHLSANHFLDRFDS
jgi:hypothetical protein